MKIRELHDWNLSPKEAIALQEKLRAKIICNRAFGGAQTVAGADAAFDGDFVIAAVIIFRLPGLSEIERVHARARLSFPYIPGLLSFREGPALLNAFEKLKTVPDAVMFDGQGIAHPRGFGLASHLGLWLDIPAIGCAKSRLFGEFDGLGNEAGSLAPLISPRGDTVGAALRSREGTRPVFISAGHLIDLDSTIKLAIKCLDGKRIPKPTREADKMVAGMKKQHPIDTSESNH